jgi:hypothetical protein
MLSISFAYSPQPPLRQDLNSLNGLTAQFKKAEHFERIGHPVISWNGFAFFRPSQTTSFLGLGQLSRGLYIIRIESNGTWFTKKILKQ